MPPGTYTYVFLELIRAEELHWRATYISKNCWGWRESKGCPFPHLVSIQVGWGAWFPPIKVQIAHSKQTVGLKDTEKILYLYLLKGVNFYFIFKQDRQFPFFLIVGWRTFLLFSSELSYEFQYCALTFGKFQIGKLVQMNKFAWCNGRPMNYQYLLMKLYH